MKRFSIMKRISLTTRKWMLLMMIVITQNIYAENGHREKLSPWLRQQCIEMERATRRASLSTGTENAGEVIVKSCRLGCASNVQ